MIDLQAVQIGQALVPVVGVLLHDPDFFVSPLYVFEWACAGKGFDWAQAVIVLFQGLFTHDDVPATGKGSQHKILWARFAQLELDGMAVAHVDRFHSRKEGRTWTAKALGGKDDAREGGV